MKFVNYTINPLNAVNHDSSYGPIFGGGFDLRVCNFSDTCRNSYMDLHSYEFPNGLSGNEGGKFIVGGSDHKFQSVEIKVFQVL